MAELVKRGKAEIYMGDIAPQYITGENVEIVRDVREADGSLVIIIENTEKNEEIWIPFSQTRMVRWREAT